MYVIKGYKINKVSLKKVEDVFEEAKKKATAIAEKRYSELLAREIENIVDNVILSNIPKPDKPIYDTAMDALDKKITYALLHGDKTEYNFNVSASVLTYENATYIELCSATEMYDTIFDDISGVENYCVTDDQGIFAAVDEKYEIWKEIMKKYNHQSVLNMKLYPCNNLPRPDAATLIYNSVEKRAEMRARHYVTNVLLGGYSCGEQIPPYNIMELMDYALLRSSELAPAIEEKKKALMNILPDITQVDVTQVIS